MYFPKQILVFNQRKLVDLLRSGLIEVVGEEVVMVGEVMVVAKRVVVMAEGVVVMARRSSGDGKSYGNSGRQNHVGGNGSRTQQIEGFQRADTNSEFAFSFSGNFDSYSFSTSSFFQFYFLHIFYTLSREANIQCWPCINHFLSKPFKWNSSIHPSIKLFIYPSIILLLSREHSISNHTLKRQRIHAIPVIVPQDL